MYFVIETQTNGNVGSGIISGHETKDAAENTYHTVLASAAISSVEKHGAFLISDDFRYFKRELYDRTNPEPLEDE